MAGLDYYMHDGPTAFRFELAGSLAGVDAARLDQAWRTVSSTIGVKILTVGVTSITAIDDKGHDLLLRWHHTGARYIANSAASRSLIESITRHPHLIAGPATRAGIDQCFIGSAVRTAGFLLLLAMTLLFPVTASASGDAENSLSARYSRSGSGCTTQRRSLENVSS